MSGHIHQENFFIFTGALGAGKSTTLKLLTNQFPCVQEPARQLIIDERNNGGDAHPQGDHHSFVKKLMDRFIEDYRDAQEMEGTVFFDRGLPDAQVYGEYFKLEDPPDYGKTHHFIYNRRVFFFPSWEEIYSNDSERTVSFKEAERFGKTVKEIYKLQGYSLVEVPKAPPLERVQFILENIR